MTSSASFTVNVSAEGEITTEASGARVKIVKLRDLETLAMLVRAVGGKETKGLRTHLEEHWNARPEGRCEFCKLEGKILGGRKRIEEGRTRTSGTHFGGTVQVKRIPQGITGAELAARLARKGASKANPKPSRLPGFEDGAGF